MVKIRTYTKNDYEAIAAIRNATQPEPVNVAVLQENDQRDDANPSVTRTRFVAEDEQGTAIGYANVGRWSWLPKNHFSLYVAVREDHRRRGIGTQLFGAAQQWALEQGAEGEFTAFMRGDDEGSFAWAQRQGFYLDLQRTESVLDLKNWDVSRFAGQVEKVRAGGLTLVSMPEVKSDDLLRGLYDLEAATAPDVPDYEGHMPTWEEWRRDFLDWKAPKVIALGMDGERVVGVSMLALPRVEGAGAYTGYTGVLREYRGRGLALALKLLTIDGALAHGAPRMRTNNDLENPAMLAVNAKLGYEMVPGPRRIKKKL